MAQIDDCQKAPSPILPAKNELIWGAISFVVLFGLLWKFACPGIKKGMDDRTERIRNDLDAADTAKAEADQVLADYRAQLADARNESARIIEEARQQADALTSRSGAAALQAELAEMRERAAADVEARSPRPSPTSVPRSPGWPSELPRSSCSTTSIARRRTQLVENYINQVGSRNVNEPRRTASTLRRCALFEVARPRAPSTRSRTSSSASPARSRAPTSCATRSTDRAHPGDAPEQIVEDLLGTKASPVTTSLVIFDGRGRPCA